MFMAIILQHTMIAGIPRAAATLDVKENTDILYEIFMKSMQRGK